VCPGKVLRRRKGLAGQVFSPFFQRKLGALRTRFLLWAPPARLILDPFSGWRSPVGNGLAKFHPDRACMSVTDWSSDSCRILSLADLRR